MKVIEVNQINISFFNEIRLKSLKNGKSFNEEISEISGVYLLSTMDLTLSG